MPLHLLGKKSWNVYNPENIGRVRRDEAEAQVRDEEAERERRDSEAAERLSNLRGGESDFHTDDIGRKSNVHSSLHVHEPSRNKRKLKGEDDTDREIRLAKKRSDVPVSSSGKYDTQSLKDHLNASLNHGRSSDDKRTKDQANEVIGMRFKDAAGYGTKGLPWYSESKTEGTNAPRPGKDVRGKEDLRRYGRDQQRIKADDPLLAIKKGVKQVRENERQRRSWLAQREKDMYEVERLARLDGAQRRKRDDEQSLNDFSLGPPLPEELQFTGRRQDRQHGDGPRKHKHRSGRRAGREHRYRHDNAHQPVRSEIDG